MQQKAAPGGAWTGGPVVLPVSLAELEESEQSSGCSVHIALNHQGYDGVACFSLFKEFLES